MKISCFGNINNIKSKLLAFIHKWTIARRKKVIHEYKNHPSQIRNEYIDLIRKYFGISIIITMYAICIINNWPEILKPNSNNSIWTMVIPLKIITCELFFISISLLMYMVFTWMNQQGSKPFKFLSFIHDNVVYPILQEFNDSIASFLIANLTLIAILYAVNWHEVANHWNESMYSKNIVVATIKIIFGAIIMPMVISFLCVSCHTLILSLRFQRK